MELLPIRTQADSWIRLVFAAKAVEKGGVVRRSVHWVEREIGRERFIREVQARGYHMLECGGQFVVICNSSGMRVIC